MGTRSRGDRIASYELESLIGRGGMGEVWRARDSSLGRWVALKLITGDGLERLRREAQTAASLAHPGIVRIYAVGDGWIAMEFVEGVTIGQAGLGAAQSAAAIRDAARAVAHAHAGGVVHRDLKPANIMIDRAGTVRVMDFGLARATREGQSLTGTGMMVGTPAYMSPEQARAERADARSDVYGLGATLYELLARRAPFDGSNVLDIAMKVVAEDPGEIAGAPRDLAAIAMKCMEKEPGRRYATATELADDLDRYLRGEPVAGRPAGIARRLKRRALQVAAAAVLVAGAVAVGWALRRGERAAVSAEQELLGQTRAAAKTALEAALDLRRAGNLKAMRELAPRVEEACRRTSERLPAAAEPHFLLGRIYRALMRDGDALREQEAALAKQPDHAGARYEHALLLSRRLQGLRKRLVEEAWRAEADRLRERGVEHLEPGEWKVPAVDGDPRVTDLVRRVEADLAEVKTAELEAADSAFARGLRAWMGSRLDEAAAAFREAAALSPRLVEAIEALAYLAGNNLRVASEWLTLGIQHDRGYVPYFLSRGALHLMSSGNARVLGMEPKRFFGLALADLEEAAALDPESAQILQMRSDARCRMAGATGSDDLFRLAEEDATKAIGLEPRNTEPRVQRAVVRTDRGLGSKEPEPHYRAALDDLEEALRLDGHSDLAWKRKGMVLTNLANRVSATGGDAEPHYRDAIDALGEAVKLNPSKADAWMHRGLAAANLAAHRRERGGDPSSLERRAIADYGEAIQLMPLWADAWLRRAAAWISIALDLGRSGADTTAAYEQAEHDCAQAVRIEPAWWWPFALRGRMRSNRAARVEARGGDPLTLFEQARGDLEKAVSLDTSDGTLLSLGDLYANWGVYDARSGRDPRPRYRAALEVLDRALARNVGPDETWQSRASAKYNLGAWEARERRDPTAWFESALKDIAEALARNDVRVDTWVLRAKIRSDYGSHLEATGRDPETLYRSVVTDLDRVLKMQPARLESYTSRGVAKAKLASWEEGRGRDPEALLASAIEDFGRADSRDVTAKLNLGKTALNIAFRKIKRSEDPSAALRSAVTHFDAVLTLATAHAEAWMHRGVAYLHLARFAKKSGGDGRTEYAAALKSCEEAVRLQSNTRNFLEKAMKECTEALRE